LNPPIFVDTVYVPGRTLANEYRPSGSEFIDRLALVEVEVSFTATPGTTAPD
jgi:hypothetical protein